MQRFLLPRAFVALLLAFAIPAALLPWSDLFSYKGVALQSALSFVLVLILRLPWWWRGIVPAFFPAAVMSQHLSVPPYWFLLAFLLLWLVFGSVAKQRVPLFLSNRATMLALQDLVPEHARFVDMGAGTGTVLSWLSIRRPDLMLTGVEHAFLPWLYGRFRLRQTSVHWLRSDFSDVGLHHYDVIYTFLSPAAMPYIWERFLAEAKQGALLISNAFIVENSPPNSTVVTGERERDRLYIWRKT